MLYSVAIRGDRVKRRRLALEMDQGEAAAKAHVSAAHWSDIENRKQEKVGADIVAEMALVLETSMEFLMGMVDDPRPIPRWDAGELSPEEEEMLRSFRGLDQDHQSVVLRLVKDLA